MPGWTTASDVLPAGAAISKDGRIAYATVQFDKTANELPKDDVNRTQKVVEQVVDDLEASGYTADENIGRVSLVGAGMKTHPGVAATMFETLANEHVNIEMISTSSIRISCVVATEDIERAVRALHDAFDLGDAG